MSDTLNDRDDRLAQLLTEALEAFRTRKTLDVASWQVQHPELADELPELLDTLRHLDTAVEDWKTIASPETRPFPAGPPDPDSALPTLPEQVGRYRILDRLGEGGMGTVYRAEDPQLQRVVALKVPRFEGPERLRETAVKRFLREARAAAQVRHPHVCPIHDVGEQDGIPYVVMEYVEGQSLAERLSGGRRYDDPLDAVRLVRQVAEALAAVHARGLVHRDLKPGNILLDTSGRAILTDFGLAHSEQDGEQLTADGALVGTPAYMAPEQASVASGPVGPWTDLYSLGVVLYQMLAGRLPFQGPVLQLLYSIAHETPAAPSEARPDLGPALDALVLRAMARRPEDRYDSARAFADALEHWSTGVATPTQTATPAEPAPVAKPASTVVRAALPDGSTVTVTLEGGAAKPSKLNVSVREQRGRKKRRLFAVSVTLALSVLLLLGGLALQTLTRPVAQVPDQRVSQAMPPMDPRPPAGLQPKQPPEPPAQVGLTRPEDPRAAAEEKRREEERLRQEAAARLADAQRRERGAESQMVLARGNALRKAGKLTEAIADYRKAVELQPAAAEAYLNLGAALKDQGQSAEAEASYRKAISLEPANANAYSNLGILLAERKKLPEAEQAYREAVRLVPGDATPHYNLGTVLRAQGKPDEAVKEYEQALTLAEQVHGNDTLETAAIGADAAKVYQGLGQKDRAGQLYQRSLEVCQVALRAGENRVEVTATLEGLADVALARDKKDRAVSLLQQSLQIRREQLGDAAPQVSATLDKLGSLYVRTGRYAEAEASLRRSLAIRKEKLGPNHPALAAPLEELASVCEKMGRDREAEVSLRESLAIQRAALGADHPEVRRLQVRLASLETKPPAGTEVYHYTPPAEVRTRSKNVWVRQDAPNRWKVGPGGGSGALAVRDDGAEVALLPDALGSTDIRVLVSARLGYTTLAGLRFQQTARVNIWEDGTVEVDHPDVRATDAEGGTYVAQQVSLPRRTAVVMVKQPSKPPEVPKPPELSPEERNERIAATKLKNARELLQEGMSDRARQLCEEILKTYSGTKAAAEAKKLLEK